MLQNVTFRLDRRPSTNTILLKGESDTIVVRLFLFYYNAVLEVPVKVTYVFTLSFCTLEHLYI